MNTDFHFIGMVPCAQYKAELDFLTSEMIPALKRKNPNHPFVAHLERVCGLLRDGIEKSIKNDRLEENRTQMNQRYRILSELEASQRRYIEEREWTEDYQLHEAQMRARRTLSESVYRQTKGQPEPQPEGYEEVLRPGLTKLQAEANR
jgi:hypothetical protein